MGGDKSNKNAGFSLVELIVAVLIMAILAGGAIMAFTRVYNARTERAAGTCASIMKRARQKALSMDSETIDVYAEFTLDSGTYWGKIYCGSDEVASEKIGNDSLQLNFTNHLGASSGQIVSDSKKVCVFFKKSTGGIDKVEVISGSSHTIDVGVDQLVISGSGDTMTVIIGKVTGRCYIAE